MSAVDKFYNGKLLMRQTRQACWTLGVALVTLSNMHVSKVDAQQVSAQEMYDKAIVDIP